MEVQTRFIFCKVDIHSKSLTQINGTYLLIRSSEYVKVFISIITTIKISKISHN